MPQSLDNRMSKPATYLKVEDDFNEIARKFGLECGDEFRMHGEECFINGSALINRHIDISDLGEAFLKCSSDVNVTVVLPVAWGLEGESEIIRKVVAIGGGVALQPKGVSFAQFVNADVELLASVEPVSIAPKILVPQVAKLDSNTFLSPYYYTPAELEALCQAYRDEDDSESIVS